MMNGDTHQATHSFVDLVDILKGKLRCLAENFKDVNEMVSPVVRMRIAVLRDIQRQHDELKAKFLEERAALEARYQRLYEPLYIERYEIVNGLVEVESAEDESTNGTPADDKATEEKGVPGFWLTAMKTHEVVYKEIRDPDEEALKYLKDIKWRRTDDFKSFKLEFLFNPNPFFRNTVLTKSYFMASVDEPILETAIGTDIKWFPRKCLTQKILKKRLKMGSQNGKPLTKTEVCESFFNFFYPPHIPDDDEKIDEDYAKELQSKMEADYDIGCTIRDKIIPNAVSWFTGEALHGDGPKLKYTVIDEDAGQDNEAADEDEEYENEYSDDDEDGDEQYKAKKRIHL